MMIQTRNVTQILLDESFISCHGFRLESCDSYLYMTYDELTFSFMSLCLYAHTYSFGSGQISVGKFMSAVCSLLGDANSQVRSVAMETIVEIYRHVGFRVRADLSKRGLPSARMSQLTARFNAVDATSGNHTNLTDNEVSIGHAAKLRLCLMLVVLSVVRMTGTVLVAVVGVAVPVLVPMAPARWCLLAPLPALSLPWEAMLLEEAILLEMAGGTLLLLLVPLSPHVSPAPQVAVVLELSPRPTLRRHLVSVSR